MSRSLTSLLLFTTALPGCFAAMQPAHITSQQSAGSVVDVTARALAAEGHTPDKIDAQLGIIQTQWNLTQANCVVGANAPHGNVAERLLVVVQPVGSGSELTLRLESKCCPPMQIGALGIWVLTPQCTEMGGLYSFQQEKLDALGTTLQSRLGSTASPGAGPAVSNGSGPSTL